MFAQDQRLHPPTLRCVAQYAFDCVAFYCNISTSQVISTSSLHCIHLLQIVLHYAVALRCVAFDADCIVLQSVHYSSLHCICCRLCCIMQQHCAALRNILCTVHSMHLMQIASCGNCIALHSTLFRLALCQLRNPLPIPIQSSVWFLHRLCTICKYSAILYAACVLFRLSTDCVRFVLPVRLARCGPSVEDRHR